jgi:hypothetical protein
MIKKTNIRGIKTKADLYGLKSFYGGIRGTEKPFWANLEYGNRVQ